MLLYLFVPTSGVGGADKGGGGGGGSWHPESKIKSTEFHHSAAIQHIFNMYYFFILVINIYIYTDVSKSELYTCSSPS